MALRQSLFNWRRNAFRAFLSNGMMLGGQPSGDFFSSNANRIVNCKEKNLIKTQNTTFTLFFFVFFWGLAVEPVNCSNS